MEKYKLYQSKCIINNHNSFIYQCGLAHHRICEFTNDNNSTWDYNKYNIFNITSSSVLFYKLYQELNYYIRDFIGDTRPLWIQCWLNYHKGQEVEKELPMHGHSDQYHGYISINPQNTSTIFNNGLKINNKIGQVYIGPGKNEGNTDYWDHYVKINKPYNGVRITLGFDICTHPNKITNYSNIPLL